MRQSKDALEQASGAAVVGYRAPTFSLVRKTAWALDVLAELGFLYDSSIYPVRHDRYGVPDAPRGPFLARGARHEILEIPPATVRIGGVNVPVGGGGYFRLLPWPLMKLALSLSRRDPQSGATVLYFHPWEFDPDQPRLPLKRLSRFRTYVGIRHSRSRLTRLLPATPSCGPSTWPGGFRAPRRRCLDSVRGLEIHALGVVGISKDECGRSEPSALDRSRKDICLGMTTVRLLSPQKQEHDDGGLSADRSMIRF